MPAPTWAVGQVLTASDVNSWFVPAAAYKTGDTGRTSTTLTADPDLSVPVAATGFYRVDAELFYKSTTAGTDFTWSFTIPAGAASGLYHATYIGSAGGAVIAQTNGWTDTGNAADATVATTAVYAITIHGMLAVGATPGNLTLTWAASSAAPTTTLTARSHLIAQRVG